MATKDAPGPGPLHQFASRWHDDVAVVSVLDEASLARRRLVIALEAHPGIEVVFDGAESGGMFERLGSDAPDVVVVSVTEGLPDVVERVGAALPSARVLVLVDDEPDALIDGAMLRGAIGVLSRQVPVPKVAAAVADVGAGRPVLDARAASVLARRLRAAGYPGVDLALAALDQWATGTAADELPAPLDSGPSHQLAAALARIQRDTRHAGLRGAQGR